MSVAQARRQAALYTQAEGDQICGYIHQMLVALRSQSRGENPTPASRCHRKEPSE